MNRKLIRKIAKEEILNEPVKLGACLGLPVSLCYAGLSFFHGFTPGLSQIVQIMIAAVGICVGVDLFRRSLKAAKKDMGVFSDQRLAILIGAVAMIYVAIASLIGIIGGA
jgi:hypothetical protein